MRSVRLEQCGVSTKHRFAFYDQVHTTGMDIKHTLDAKAVLTLGKDMTFRDYAQGAYRMRGITCGQSIHILCIPEVEKLIRRAVEREPVESTVPSVVSHHPGMLQDVSAWLVINSMRSERIQFNALSLQNVANVWRCNALRTLIDRHREFQILSPDGIPAPLRAAVEIFMEKIDFDLADTVQVGRLSLTPKPLCRIRIGIR